MNPRKNFIKVIKNKRLNYKFLPLLINYVFIARLGKQFISFPLYSAERQYNTSFGRTIYSLRVHKAIVTQVHNLVPELKFDPLSDREKKYSKKVLTKTFYESDLPIRLNGHN